MKNLTIRIFYSDLKKAKQSKYWLRLIKSTNEEHSVYSETLVNKLKNYEKYCLPKSTNSHNSSTIYCDF